MEKATDEGNDEMEGSSQSGDCRFKCTFCESSFTQKRLRDIHMRRHTYRCNRCDMAFMLKMDLLEHDASAHSYNVPEATLECKYCPFKCTSARALYHHSKFHDKQSSDKVEETGVLECKFCDFKSYSVSELLFHAKTHTQTGKSKSSKPQEPPNKKDRSNKVEETGVLECKFCDFKSFTVSELLIHAKTHTQTGKSKSSKPQEPPNKKHSSDKVEETGVLECKFCDFKSFTVSELLCHAKTHNQTGKSKSSKSQEPPNKKPKVMVLKVQGDIAYQIDTDVSDTVDSPVRRSGRNKGKQMERKKVNVVIVGVKRKKSDVDTKSSKKTKQTKSSKTANERKSEIDCKQDLAFKSEPLPVLLFKNANKELKIGNADTDVKSDLIDIGNNEDMSDRNEDQNTVYNEANAIAIKTEPQEIVEPVNESSNAVYTDTIGYNLHEIKTEPQDSVESVHEFCDSLNNETIAYNLHGIKTEPEDISEQINVSSDALYKGTICYNHEAIKTEPEEAIEWVNGENEVVRVEPLE